MIVVYDTASGSFQGGIPDDAQAIIFYMDGLYRNEQAARARFPHLFATRRAIGVTVRGALAQGEDFEPGNWQGNVGQWTRSAIAAGYWRPVVYGDISDMNASILPELEAQFGRIPPPGPGRPFRLLSAHPTGDNHICGPRSCGQLPVDADGTQNWWGSIQGGGRVDYDKSVVLDSFFQTTPPPIPPEGTVAIAAATNQDGRVEVFVELSTGEVKHIAQETPNGVWWKNWLSLGTPGK